MAAKPAAAEPTAAKSKGGGSKPDFATIGGLVLALAGILGGLILEGGKIKEIIASHDDHERRWRR